MDLNNIRELNLTLSNKANYICKYGNNKLENDEVILDIEKIKKIVDILAQNCIEIDGDFPTPLINIYGITSNIWESTFIPLLDYVKDIDQFDPKITIFLDKNNIYTFTDDMLNYCRINQIYISCYIGVANGDILEQIKRVLNYRPLSKIIYVVNDNNISKIFEDYQSLNTLNLDCLDYYFSFLDIQDSQQTYDIIEDQFKQINLYVENLMKNDELPIVPLPILRNIIKIIFNDYQQESNTKLFNFYHLMLLWCGSVGGRSIYINPDGQIFLCPKGGMDENSDYIVGCINDEIKLDDINIYDMIFPGAEELIYCYMLNPSSAEFPCYRCKIGSLCSSGCFCEAIPDKGASEDDDYVVRGNQASNQFCIIERKLYNLSCEFAESLVKDNNLLAKDYIVGSFIKGVPYL